MKRQIDNPSPGAVTGGHVSHRRLVSTAVIVMVKPFRVYNTGGLNNSATGCGHIKTEVFDSFKKNNSPLCVYIRIPLKHIYVFINR